MLSERRPELLPPHVQPVYESPNQSQRRSSNRNHSVSIEEKETAILERRRSRDEGQTDFGRVRSLCQQSGCRPIRLGLFGEVVTEEIP